MIFDHFDQIRIVNLPSRTDRRREMIGELRRAGIAQDPRVSFFDACNFDEKGTFYSKGARGCYHSHLAILEAAAATNSSVLILEDDCDFTPAIKTFEPSGDWSIFYGGYDAQSEDLQTADIVGSHFMGFSAQVVPPLVDYLHRLLERTDHPSIDGAYIWYRRAHPDVKTCFAVPPLGVQRPSRTDVGEANFLDRIPALTSALALARKVKRRARRSR